MTSIQIQQRIRQYMGHSATRYAGFVHWLAERLSTEHFRGLPLTMLIGLLVANTLILSEIAENVVNAEPMVQVDV